MKNRVTVISSVAVGIFAVLFSSYQNQGFSTGTSESQENGRSSNPIVTNVLPYPMFSITTTMIDICTQHAPKCPLDPATWQGEPDAWKQTGKKWTWYPDTPYNGREIVWEYSYPYSGSNPAYSNQREDHYADYTNSPDEYPVVTGTAPVTYDWERWISVDDSFKLLQFGRPSEGESHNIGESDCESGVYYPVVDHNIRYAHTPMATTAYGQCIGGGYIAAHLAELWGERFSPTRINKCDNDPRGIPPDESQKGNAICKSSPYVGVVYQRYVFSAGNSSGQADSVGCEAVLYAWGWQEPDRPTTGQNYQTWFRNGELRFSRWYGVASQITEGAPAPDDHTWWDSKCEGAWYGESNWLYTGKYKIGDKAYEDTITQPAIISNTIPISGGDLTSPASNTSMSFLPDTFTETVTVTYAVLSQGIITGTGHLAAINTHFYLAAFYQNSGQPAAPTKPYTITLQYTDDNRGGAIEETLSLYFLNDTHWVKETTNMVNTNDNTISATPNHFSFWAVLGETKRIYLPLVILQ